VYEKEIFIYDPSFATKSSEKEIENVSPEFSLQYLEPTIIRGAIFLVFLNQVSTTTELQNATFSWIPYMPPFFPTKDKLVGANKFASYPDSECKFLAPIVSKSQLQIPVQFKLRPPKPKDYPCDVFRLFWNGQGEHLGTFIRRGRGALIVLPRSQSNEDVISTFLHRVLPKIFDLKVNVGLIDRYVSPSEKETISEIDKLDRLQEKITEQREKGIERLASSQRDKNKVINADPTAIQILLYHETAKRQEDVALFYLYKIFESVENKYGGETEGMKVLGCSTEWKSVKRIANASYGDIRHAPKPGDAFKKWSEAEIKSCFEATEKLILAYFDTLFDSTQTTSAQIPGV
jgi:hypothetical protein